MKKMNMKAGVNRALRQVYDQLLSEVDIYRVKVERKEKEFLKEVGVSSKQEYISKVSKQFDEDAFMQMFFEITGEISDDSIKRAKSVALTETGRVTTAEKIKYIKSRQKRITAVLNQTEKILTEIYQYTKGARGGSQKMNNEEVKKYKALVANALHGLPKTKVADKINVQDMNYTTYKGINELIRNLKRYILGNVLEVMIAKTIVESDNIVPDISKSHIGEALQRGLDGSSPKVEWVGGKGMTKSGQEKYKTTDIVFNVGRIKVGIDVKSNKEFYMKSFQRNFLVFDSLSAVLNKGGIVAKGQNQLKILKGVGIKNPELMKNVLYALVNYRIFTSNLKDVINGSEDRPVSKTFLSEYVSGPLQKILMSSIVTFFIDDYLYNFSNEYRDQIIVMLQSDVYFLSDFIDKIVHLVGQMSMSGTSSSALGYVKLDNLGGSKALTNFSDFSDLWSKKNKVLNDLFDNYDPTKKNPSFYNKIFDKTRLEMAAITNKAIKTNYYVRMMLPINKQI